MELTNILLILVFIVLPIALGVWALVTRRNVLRRRDPARRPIETQGAEPTRRTQPARRRAPDIERSAMAETAPPPPPPRDWASHVQPTRQIRTVAHAPVPRRPYYPPRYAGKAAGTVTRLTPRAYRLSFRPRSGR